MINITQKIVPLRAWVYLKVMGLSQHYIFIHNTKEMLKILSDMEQGREIIRIDLLLIIRRELFAYLKRWEERNGKKMESWPELQLSDLRETNLYCSRSNIFRRILAALCRLAISSTSTLAYICMLASMFTNAGLLVIIYPFAVFGYALVEETRPGRKFWRFILFYTLALLVVKYLINLEIINLSIIDTDLPYLDGFIQFGLHH